MFVNILICKPIHVLSFEYFNENYPNTHKHEYFDSNANQSYLKLLSFSKVIVFFSFSYDLYIHLIMCVKILLNHIKILE